MVKRKIRTIITVMLMAVFFAACGKKNTEELMTDEAVSTETEESSEEQTFFVHPGEREIVIPASSYSLDWNHGSCKNIADRTLIVSIFLSDRNYAWNSSDEKDSGQMQREVENLKVATDWIKDAVAEYEVTADFVYDWNENPDLKLEITSDKDVCNSEDEKIIWEIIDSNIDNNKLLEKYEADNILYMIVQNVPKDWDLDSFTWIYEGDPYPYEFTVMYQYRKGANVGAASYAHEILHAFGAHDLYIADENETYVTSRDYLDYLKANGSRDIMFTVYDSSGRQGGMTISGKFTPLDAYYVGIGGEPEEVEEYGLDKNEYQ